MYKLIAAIIMLPIMAIQLAFAGLFVVFNVLLLPFAALKGAIVRRQERDLYS